MADNVTKTRYYQFYDKSGKKFDVDAKAFDADMEGFAEEYPDVSMRMVDKNGEQWDIPVANVGKAMQEGGYRMWAWEQSSKPKPAEQAAQPAQSQPQQKPAVVQQSKPASNPQPMQMPTGFGELDLQQAQRMGAGRGPVSWNEPGVINPTTGKSEPKQEKNIAKQLDRAIKSDKKAAKESGLDTAVQRMQEEREYAEATGKPLSNIVNTPVTAPTAVRDENGQILMGQTTDEQRVAQYQQQEKEIARKKIINPIVDDIQKQLEGKVPLYTSPINMSSGPQWNAMMNQTEQLKRMNEADSPEKLWDTLNEYFGLGKKSDIDDEELRKQGKSVVLAHWDEKDNGEDFTSKFLVDNQDAIQQAAARLGMNTDDFVWQELIPKMSETIAERFNQNMGEKYSVKNTADYLAKRMINSSVGALARMGTMTPQQSQFMQEGLEKSNQGEGQHFNAAWYDKALGEVAQFLPDTPLMMIGGAMGGAAAKGLGALISRAGAEGLGTMIATGSPFLAANVGKMVKYGGLLGHAVTSGAANMGSFMGMSSMLQAMASTPVDKGYLSSIGMAGWEGLKEGAKIGTALGVLGTVGGAGKGLWKTPAGRAAWAAGTFLGENQIFALSDYLADPEKFNWVDSSLDALYMQMAGKVQGMTSHGADHIKNSWRQIFEPMPKMPTLTETEKAQVQRAFGGMSFEQIAGDMGNLEKILSDKQNIPLTIRQKISGRVLGVFEPNRPFTYNTNIRGKEIYERAKDGELINIHTFETPDERDAIMQEIADRKQHDQMAHDFIVLDMKEQSAPILDSFAQEFGMTRQELWDMMQKKPVELVDDEYDLMQELGRRLHEAANPRGELHPEQANTDGAELAGDSAEMNPDTAAAIGQEVAMTKEAYENFPLSEDLRTAVYSLGDARLDDIYMYVRNNYSGPEVDEYLKVIADYANAKAKQQGYIDKTATNIDEQVAQDVDEKSFHGKIDEEPDMTRIITITKDGEEFVLLNGNIGTRDGVIVDPDKSGDLIIARTKDGRWVSMAPDALMTISSREPKDAYADRVREELQIQDTNTALETGLVELPKSEEEAKPVEGEANTGGNQDNAGGEAGASTGTGANEPSATAISKIPTLKDEQGADILDEEGDPQYQWEQAPLDDTLSALAEINKGNRKRVTDTVDAMQKAAANEVEAAEKLKPKSSNPIKMAREQDEIDAQKAEAQKKLDYWTQAKQELEKVNNPETNLNVEPAENNKTENVVPLQPKAASEQKKAKTADEKRAERIVQLKQQYGEHFDDDFTKAQSADELASMYVGRNRTLSREDLAKELGYKLGLKTDEPWAETLLAKTGEGKTLWKVAHAAWESDENPIIDNEGNRKFSDQEIHDALLSIFRDAKKKSDIMDYAINAREEVARRNFEEAQRREAEMRESGELEEVKLTDEELARIEKEKPFGNPTEDDFPELPKSQQDKLVEAVNEILDPNVPASVIVIDGKRTSDKDWYDIASEALGGVFPTDEDIKDVKRWMQKADGGYLFADKTGKLYIADHVSIDKVKELYNEIKEAYERAAEEEAALAAADSRTRETDERVDDTQREDGRDESRETDGRVDESQGEGRPESGRESESSERDEYLKPRNEKEEKIIEQVHNQLQQEIAEAVEDVNKARAELEKARTKESDRATDMFANDEAFAEPDAIFSQEEMGLDTSAEGVEKRTRAEQEKLQEAVNKLNRLQSQEERNSRIRGALDNERRQTSFDPMATIEETAQEFKEEHKEQEKQIGITTDETPEQKADRERAEKLADTPLTNEEVDSSSASDVQKTLAKAYLNGNHGILQEAAYLNVYNDVRNRRQDNEANRSDADRTQLAGPNDREERGLGQPGESIGDMAARNDVSSQDEGQSESRGVSGVEDSKVDVPASAGERGNSGISESKPEVDGLPTGNEQPVGGSRVGSDGRDVRSPRADQRGSGVVGQAEQRENKAGQANSPKPAAGSDAAIAASKQRLAELRKKFKNAGRNGNLSVSLVGMNDEQIGILGEIITESANLGYQYIHRGMRDFNEWRKQMLADFKDWLQEDFKWTDADVEEYLREVWNCEYNIDGVTRTIGEWSSFMGEKELKKVVKADRVSKFEQQKAAESVETKVGDIDNIRESLPFLLPEQQDDVYKAETQFFDEAHQDREHGYGKGMMFTNGTGTGKTYTGLGIVKRFVKQGKGRVLILTPSQEKVTDWRNDGLNLGLDIESLDEDAKAKGTSATKAKGKGVVVTTYANARQNLAMLEDCFDLIVYDESHKIMESKDAVNTTMMDFHEMLTNKNVERSIDRQTYWLPEWIEHRNLIKEREENRATLDKLDDYADNEKVKVGGKDVVVAELKAKLNARMGEIEKRLEELRPIMQEIRESKRPQAEIDSKRTKTVFLSATPFNVRESLRYAEGYLFSFPEEDKNTIGSYNHRSPEDAFLESMFPAGYRWRYGRLESHVSNAEALGRQEIDFSDYLQNTLQTMSGRMIASDYDYSRDFPVMTLDHAGRFNQAMSEVYRNKRYQPLAEAFRKSFDYNYSTALFEAMKTSLVNDRIKEHLKRGQKVVVFHRRRTSGDLEPPFRRALDLAELMASQEQDDQTKANIRSAIAAFEHDFADMLEWEKTLDYTLPREQIEKVFGKDKVAFFSGAETKKTKHQSVEEFMKDNGGKDIIVIQEASGKEGISLHDKTGEHQRVEINLALPQSPIAFIQIEGRIYRIGQKSNAIFEYPLLGLDLETSLFAQRFNNALGTTENLALGSKARNLRKSIANSVLENTGEVNYDRQGYGGKDMDGRVDEAGDKDGFDVSIQDYYGNQKMSRGRDNREGVDYFPTPEPIGYKMVEWGQMMEGETALEPSAGHGAIARYVPETNAMTAIEPSASLFTKLQMRAGGPGRRFEEMPFEDYPLANKHDVILMNPPYGVQGKMAMEHVAKAFKHLNEGGRVIAIIPDGPAMERRLDAWLNSAGSEGLNGAAVVVGEVKLPDVAFGRAGTNVRTRVVVIDKVTRAEMRRNMPQKVTIDLSNEESIGGLFDRIRNVRMPERTIDQVAINEKRALRTKKQLEDNPFVRSVYIGDGRIVVKNLSRYDDVQDIALNLANVNEESVLLQYKGLKEALEHPETVENKRWANRSFGTGKNRVPATDAIKDYAQTAIKTLENISGMTADQMDKRLREMSAERERKEQERLAEFNRIQEEGRRKREAHIKEVTDVALAENKDNESLSPAGIEMNMKIAHGNIYLMAEKSKRILREAGIDWQTGHKIEKNEPVNARTATVVEPTPKKQDYEYALDKNTRTGEDMHLVKFNGSRLSNEDYKTVERKAKAQNGYYNRFKKAWHFPTEEDARKFAESMSKMSDGTVRFSEKKDEEKLNNKYKGEKSEDLFVSLSQKDGEDLYESANEINRRIESGASRIVRLGEEAERGRRTAWHRIGSLLAGAYTDKKSSGGSGEVSENGGREGLHPWSKREADQEKTYLLNLEIAKRVGDAILKGKGIISEAKTERESKDGKLYASGFESNVYRSADGKKAIKFMNFDDISYDDAILKRLDDLALFNTMFPDSAYDVVGYANNKDGRLKVVAEQPFFDGETAIAHFKDFNKAYDFIDNYLEKELGLKPLKYEDDGADTWGHTNGEVIVSDVNYDNVIIDKDGKPHVIDCCVERVGDRGREREKGFAVEDSENTRFKEGEETAERQHEDNILKDAEKLSKKLGTPVKVATSIDEVTNREAAEAIRAGRKIQGWYDTKTGEITLYLPNISSKYEGERVVAHETIGHKGLRALLGEKGYKSYCKSLLYDLKNPELEKYWMENLAKNGFDTYRTIDEFLAEAAEKGYGDLSMWQKVKESLTDALRSVGFTMSPSISDVKYMVWLSKHNLEKGNIMNQVEREALLYRLGKERYEAKVRNGEFGYDQSIEGVSSVPYFPGEGKTLFRHTPSVKNQRRNYERALKRMGYVWKEAHIDAMQSAVELMRSISGVKKIEDIPSAENFVLLENQMSSKEEQMDFLFNRDYMEPLDDAVAKCLPDMGKDIDQQLKNLQLYMIKKHGLERNRVLFVRDALRDMRNTDKARADQLEQDYNDFVHDERDDLRNGIIDLKEYHQDMDNWIKKNIDPAYNPGEKDYSGLTSLYGKGYNEMDVIDEVMSTEAMLGDERVKDLWDKTNAVSQFGLDMEYEGGLDSKEKHDKVSDMFEWYVPLRGYDEKTAEEVYDYLEEGGGDGRKWAGPVLMNAKGRESLADVDVFATLGAMSSSAINRSLRNQMKQAFARFVRDHYNDVDADKRLVTELPYLWAEKQHDPVTGADVWVEKFPDIPENAKADDIAAILDQYQQDMQAKEAAGDAKRVRQNSNIPFRPAKSENKAQHIVDVWINGEKHSFVVNGNPRAAQAINGQLKAERNSNILWLSSLSHFMAKMNTSYSPDFIMRNTERDLIYSAANIAVKENAEYWFKWAKNYGVATGRVAAGVPGMHTNLFKRYRDGNLNMSNSTDRYFKEFMENGGETGWVERKNLDKWKEAIKNGVKKDSKPEQVGKAVLNALPDAIEAMNERAENMARFATYMTSRQMGRSITRSVSDAKEVSVNFNRKGAGKKTVGMNKGDNSWLSNANAYMAGWSAQNLQDYIMFYNAGVQGMTNMIKNVANHPIKGTAAFAAFALAGMLMPQLNQYLFEEDDDKTGKEPENPYAELPEYVRRNNLCIYNGKGSFITIALPIELRAMYGIGDMAASYINHPELRSTKNMGEDIVTQLSQVAPLDFFGEGAGPLWAIVPSGVRPFAEAASNKNWLGQPIERDEERWNKNKPRWTRAFKNVGDAYVGASKRLNAATNPYNDENIKGWADGALTDPALVEHIVNGYFGGVGSTVNRVAQLVKHADEMSPTEAITSNWMPIVRTQHYSPNERTRYARTRNKWWYYKEEADKTQEVIKALKKRGEHDPLDYMKSVSEEEGKKGARAKIMEKAYKRYSKIKKKMENTDDLQQKNIYQLQMDQIMEGAVKELDKIK